jgi:hypothetical protein
LTLAVQEVVRQSPFGDVDKEVVAGAVDGDFEPFAEVAEEAGDTAAVGRGRRQSA